jgi:lysophospholipase L1-like esterase
MSMKRLQERIAAKAKDYTAAPVLIVALGDSVTQGWMELGQLDSEAVYHSRLRRMLERRHSATTFSVLNAGAGGECAPGGLKRLERDVLRHDPDLVLVAYGLNDASRGMAGLPAFTEALRAIIGRVRSESKAEVVLLTPNGMLAHLNPAVPNQYRALAPNLMRTQTEGVLAAYAQAIRDVGTELAVPVADVYAVWERHAAAGEDVTAWLANGLNHPTREKHAVAAEAVAACLGLSPDQRDA